MQLVLAIVIVVFASAIGAPLVFFLTSPAKWSTMDPHQRKQVLRSMRSGALAFGVAAFLYTGIIAAVSQSPVITVALSLVISAALVGWALSAVTPLKRIEKLGKQLEDPAQREPAKQALLGVADSLKLGDATADMMRVSVAVVLANARCIAEARSVLESVKEEQFDGHERELYMLTMLECLVHANALAEARALIARLPPLGEGSAHDFARRHMEARLLIKEQRPDEALAVIATPASDPVVERNRRIVLAHVCAAREDEAGLEAAFQWLEEHHGKAVFQRVIDPEGPASARALARLGGGAAPYR